MKCLCENKLRLFLTVVSITVAVSSVLLIGAVSSCGARAVWAELDSLGMNGLIISASSGTISGGDVASINNVGGVEKTAPVTVKATMMCGKSGDVNAVVWGIDENAQNVVSLELVSGRPIDKGDIKGSGRVCMVDQSLARELFGSEDAVGKTAEIINDSSVQSFEIVGVVKTGKGIMQSLMGSSIPAFLYAPYTSLGSNGSYDQVFLKTDGIRPTDRITSDLKRALGSGITVTDLAGQRSTLESMLSTVTLILTVIGSISLFVSGISIMNIMLISVGERTKEIGIKKSIGASRSDILLDFLLESVIISLAGTAFGIAISAVVSFFASVMLGVSLSVTFSSIAKALMMSVTFGVLFGIFPAYKASKLKPVEALRR